MRDGRPGPATRLVLRRNPETGERKTDRRNAPAATPPTTLARLSGRRWPTARCGAEGQQHPGLGDYAARSWRGGHQHRTLGTLARFVLVRLHRRWGGQRSPR